MDEVTSGRPEKLYPSPTKGLHSTDMEERAFARRGIRESVSNDVAGQVIQDPSESTPMIEESTGGEYTASLMHGFVLM